MSPWPTAGGARPQSPGEEKKIPAGVMRLRRRQGIPESRKEFSLPSDPRQSPSAPGVPGVPGVPEPSGPEARGFRLRPPEPRGFRESRGHSDGRRDQGGQGASLASLSQGSWASGFRLQTSGFSFRVQTSNSKFQLSTLEFKLQTSNFKLQLSTLEFKVQTSSFNFGVQTPGLKFQPWVSGWPEAGTPAQESPDPQGRVH